MRRTLHQFNVHAQLRGFIGEQFIQAWIVNALDDFQIQNQFFRARLEQQHLIAQ